jgi:hypothetical protein
MRAVIRQRKAEPSLQRFSSHDAGENAGDTFAHQKHRPDFYDRGFLRLAIGLEAVCGLSATVGIINQLKQLGPQLSQP